MKRPANGLQDRKFAVKQDYEDNRRDSKKKQRRDTNSGCKEEIRRQEQAGRQTVPRQRTARKRFVEDKLGSNTKRFGKE